MATRRPINANAAANAAARRASTGAAVARRRSGAENPTARRVRNMRRTGNANRAK